MGKNTNKHNNRSAKKQTVLGKSSKSRIHLKIGLPVILIVLLVAGAAFWTASRSKASLATASLPGGEPSGVSASSEADSVSHPLDLFEDGKAHHFSYRSENLTIRYFVLKSSDGVVRAAFDACDVCWQAGKGYAQDGDEMVCLNCNRRFASVRINTIQGGCNPAPLNRTVEKDRLVIKVEDILQGKTYFNL